MSYRATNFRSADFLSDIPGNLSRRVKSLLDKGSRENHEQLYALRLEFERFISHLAVLANIPEQEWQGQSVKNKIQFLSGNKAGILKEGIEHYLSFWYGMGCIGSHSGSISEEKHISLAHHVDMCLQAMLTVLYWYIQEYPPLSQKEEFKEKSVVSLEEFKPADIDNFVNPSSKKINETIEQNDVLLIHGPSWIGKTSLSCFALSKLVSEGYLPVIFHERNLISPSILFDEFSLGFNSSIQRVSLRDKAGALHKEIVSSIFRGDSCAILFDDPFGHRNFRPHSSPLSYIRMLDWVKLSQKDTSLGSIKIILNSPTIFWNAAKTLKDENTSPIFRENLEWLLGNSNQKVIIQQLSLFDYNADELSSVVRNVGLSLNCKWAQELYICDLVADSIRQSCNSFETLRLFCLDTQTSCEEDIILDSAEKYFEKSIELNYEISSLEKDLQIFLVMVYIGEAFEQLSRDYLYSKSTFSELFHHMNIGDSLMNLMSQASSKRSLDYWVSLDPNSYDSAGIFPKFRHPDIRISLEIFVREGPGKKIACELLLNSDFYKCFSYETKSIMRWESIYILCYFAELLDQEACQTIHDEWFSIPKAEFDYTQTLWAISDNWLNIKGSSLEAFAIIALKRIQNELPAARRSFIWEIINNWVYMPEEIRCLVLNLNGEEKRGQLKAKVVEWHLISFLGAVFCNYQTLVSYARQFNSESTRVCLDFANDFVRELSKVNNLNSPQYKSFEDDRVFSNRGANYTGKEVLMRVRRIGLNYGGIAEDEQVIKNIDSILSDPGR
jgi:hypothetical protein